MCTTLNYPRHATATPGHIASAFIQDGIDGSDLFWTAYDEDYENTVVGSIVEGVTGILESTMRSDEMISREDFLHSQWYRDGLEYHEDMTLGDAVLRARAYDSIVERAFVLNQADDIFDRAAIEAGRTLASITDPTGYTPVFRILSRDIPWLSLDRWVTRLGPVRGRMAYDAAQAATISALNQPLAWAIRSATGQDVDTGGYGSNIQRNATIGSMFGLIKGLR